jgi:hypothetical protein
MAMPGGEVKNVEKPRVSAGFCEGLAVPSDDVGWQSKHWQSRVLTDETRRGTHQRHFLSGDQPSGLSGYFGLLHRDCGDVVSP